MPELDAAVDPAADGVPSLPPEASDDRPGKTFDRLL
jgi:hypothetical protein